MREVLLRDSVGQRDPDAVLAFAEGAATTVAIGKEEELIWEMEKILCGEGTRRLSENGFVARSSENFEGKATRQKRP